MIFVGSRYTRVPRGNTLTASGESVGLFEVRPTTVAAENPTETYRVRAGDTLESIAAKFLGSGNKWYLLADLNPGIFWPLDLVSGDRIIIPSRIEASLV